jgi:hypothetical protein
MKLRARACVTSVSERARGMPFNGFTADPSPGAAPERSTNEGVGTRCLCGTTPDALAAIGALYLSPDFRADGARANSGLDDPWHSEKLKSQSDLCREKLRITLSTNGRFPSAAAAARRAAHLQLVSSAHHASLGNGAGHLSSDFRTSWRWRQFPGSAPPVSRNSIG